MAVKDTQEMIVQGNVSVPRDAVPVLEIGQLREAVNFLRCGCPAVQIVMKGHAGESLWSYPEKDRAQQAAEEQDRVETSFAALALSGESFPCSPTHLPADRADALVLRVTRESVGGAERSIPHPGPHAGPHLPP